MNPIRILVAEPHLGVRSVLKMLLEQQPHYLVVAEASDGEEALQQALTRRPDVVVMDVRMPGLSSADVCEQILHQLPETKVIILTTLVEDACLTAALRAGAAGYVVKRIGGRELFDMIEKVSNLRPTSV